MPWRWVPLAILASWIVLTRWRIHWQRKRHGVEAVHLREDGGWRRRACEDGARLVFLAILVECVLVARGDVALAESAVARWSGTALGLGGSWLMLGAQLQMGAAWRIGIDPGARTPLVTHGWYRLCRNPIYVFLFASWFGVCVLIPNPFTWIAFGVLAVGVRLQVSREEAWLESTHGPAWRAYAGRVGRFVPGIGRVDAR